MNPASLRIKPVILRLHHKIISVFRMYFLRRAYAGVHFVFLRRGAYFCMEGKERVEKMFLSNLSVSLLKLCDKSNLTYAEAAELCGITARYFGDIVRHERNPSVDVLEKICEGFGITPSCLLLDNACEKCERDCKYSERNMDSDKTSA